eukprot:scaffold100588_cov60-Phaeocystis_antarctica.AAC.1
MFCEIDETAVNTSLRRRAVPARGTASVTETRVTRLYITLDPLSPRAWPSPSPAARIGRRRGPAASQEVH